VSSAGPHSVPLGSASPPRLVPGAGRGTPSSGAEKTWSLGRRGHQAETGTPSFVEPVTRPGTPRRRPPPRARGSMDRGSAALAAEGAWRPTCRVAHGQASGPPLRGRQRPVSQVSGSVILTDTKTREGPDLDSGARDSAGILWDRRSCPVPAQSRALRSWRGAPGRSWKIGAGSGRRGTRLELGWHWSGIRNRGHRAGVVAAPLGAASPRTIVMSVVIFTRTRVRVRRRTVSASEEESWGSSWGAGRRPEGDPEETPGREGRSGDQAGLDLSHGLSHRMSPRLRPRLSRERACLSGPPDGPGRGSGSPSDIPSGSAEPR